MLNGENMKSIEYRPIGIIKSPFREQKGTPIQPRYGKGIEGTINIFVEYAEALDDLDGFSHITLIYHLHLSQGYKLKVTPYLDDKLRGLFATRSPRRPNPIGISVVRLLEIEKNSLRISDIDILDGTPLLDIKPYIPGFVDSKDMRIGWLADKINIDKYKKADDRFNDK